MTGGEKEGRKWCRPGRGQVRFGASVVQRYSEVEWVQSNVEASERQQIINATLPCRTRERQGKTGRGRVAGEGQGLHKQAN